MGIDWRRGRRPHKLSSGEAQGAAIAVSVASRPSVLIADELDEETATEVVQLLGDLRQTEGAAMVTMTHNHDVAGRNARRVSIRDGVLHDER